MGVFIGLHFRFTLLISQFWGEEPRKAKMAQLCRNMYSYQEVREGGTCFCLRTPPRFRSSISPPPLPRRTLTARENNDGPVEPDGQSDGERFCKSQNGCSNDMLGFWVVRQLAVG